MNLIISDQSNPHALSARNLSNTAWAFAKVQIKRCGEFAAVLCFIMERGIYIYIYIINKDREKKYIEYLNVRSPQSQSMIPSISHQSTCLFQTSPGGQR